MKRSLLVAGGAATMTALPAPHAVEESGPLAYFRQRMLAAQEATPVDLAAYEPVALTADEYATLSAVIDRLIPADELGAGAVEAGVGLYIDQALAGPYASSLEAYQTALPIIDQAAGADGFSGLSTGDQDALLTRIEAGEVTDLPTAFFTNLLQHTREGYFGDPVHGGNREFVGWDLVHFPGIKLVWSAEDQAIGTQVEQTRTSVAEYGGTGS